MEQTFGQKIVGVSFNPSNLNVVDEIKVSYAAIIDKLNDLKIETESPMQFDLAQQTITEAVTACMWAVKTLTYKD